MNIFDTGDLDLTNEAITTVLQNPSVRIERIVSRYHTTDWYDQEESEWVLLVTGEATLEFENKIVSLCAGDTLHIPPHCRHRVTATTECIWICVFWKEETI